MNVRFRSNDAYKAAFMNIFALVQLQQKIANRISELSEELSTWGVTAIWPTAITFTAPISRSLNPVSWPHSKRSFEQRTMRYQDLREIMESARPAILEKARQMGR